MRSQITLTFKCALKVHSLLNAHSKVVETLTAQNDRMRHFLMIFLNMIEVESYFHCSMLLNCIFRPGFYRENTITVTGRSKSYLLQVCEM